MFKLLSIVRGLSKASPELSIIVSKKVPYSTIKVKNEFNFLKVRSFFTKSNYFTAWRNEFLKQNNKFFQSTINLKKDTTSIPLKTIENAIEQLTPKSAKRYGLWFLGTSILVAMTLMVGGITRLTNSGLSMVTWDPITGMIPPITHEEWLAEFEKYKQYPEFAQNKNMTLSDFKGIFFFEYLHRNLGRTIGLVFGIPAAIILVMPKVTRPIKRLISLIALGVGAQGALGWYMVKSGLEEKDHIARVSHIRLMSHLGAAFGLYVALFSYGLKMFFMSYEKRSKIMTKTIPLNIHPLSIQLFLSGLVLFTALSGALVAGLDAGLVYNSFPKFADKWIPTDLFSHVPWWSNFWNNETTTQFNHRLLGITTGTMAITWSFILARFFKVNGIWNTRSLKWATKSVGYVAAAQMGLGIMTLLMYVPVPLAASHQTGSVVLLSSCLWLYREIANQDLIIPKKVFYKIK